MVLITSCVSTHYSLKPDSRLDAYKYVLITPPSHDPYGTYVELSSLFSDEGFSIFNQHTIKSLPEHELNKVLVCTYGWSSTILSSIVHLRLDDYFTHEAVFTSRGEFGMGWDMRGDALGAIRQAFMGIGKEYSGFSEEYVKYPEWERIEKNNADLVKYFDSNLSRLHPLEGIWSDMGNRYRIGIFRDDSSKKRDFVAIILSSEFPLWMRGDVKIEFLTTTYPKVFTTTYFMADKTRQGCTAHINEKGLLTIALRKQKEPWESIFIKNYPKNVESDYSKNIQPGDSPFFLSGSGFLLTETGLIVTNYHVVKDSKAINVSFPKRDEYYKARVIIKDSTNDITLLKIDDMKFTEQFTDKIPYGLADSSNIKVGKNVFTIGFPLKQILGKSPRLSKGVINSLYGINDDPRLLQISNPIQPGNSGGPLFNKNGEIVGIVVATLNAKYLYEKIGIIPQNVNFAIKVDYLKNLVSMLPEGDEIIKRSSNLADKPLEEQVKKITPFIITVKAYK